MPSKRHTQAIESLARMRRLQWDLVMIVRHHSAETFLSFSTNQVYLAGLGHRVAAVLDSRLLPLTKLALP